MTLLTSSRTLSVTLVILVVSGLHVWFDRYYLRFIPLPLQLVELVNDHGNFTPAFEDGRLNGNLELDWADITTDAGLRATLNTIREYSPLGKDRGMPSYENITFERWLAQAQVKTLLCTDATMLFIIAAWSQRLKAREWHLLPSGWPPGEGHSVAEFYNPKNNQWEVVDVQHAAIFRDHDSRRILSMADILKRFKSGTKSTIDVDYGPYTAHFIGEKVRGPTTQILFESGHISTPVLQLRQATWFATYPRNFLISGHFVIGYPIHMGRWTHDHRVLTTKLALIIFLLFALNFFISGVTLLRQRKRSN
ncbi:MAG: hypothetical protein CBB68_15555 [Rhodospirillaceae bacterium TMED8]|nr:hypothetical protein [Magnetovibrio sp.]OUT47834.1 MAG: hypothetical protein CBB68_15555 [Rhodospirillaceae bacterium TMED8]|tara:strand:- start:72 stop:992 length:921 start_codon:yes stop_codon:yes gene_type:complete